MKNIKYNVVHDTSHNTAVHYNMLDNVVLIIHWREIVCWYVMLCVNWRQIQMKEWPFSSPYYTMLGVHCIAYFPPCLPPYNDKKQNTNSFLVVCLSVAISLHFCYIGN